MQINKFKLFVNDDTKAKCIALLLKAKLLESQFIEDENDFDLGVAVGGDGSFLRMVRSCNFDTNKFFIGVNAGTLGFLQEIKPNQIHSFVSRLKSGEFNVEEVGIQKTIVVGKENYEFNSFNEIVIREKDLNTIYLKVCIDGQLLENFAGDGILISTSSGSTAYNLSFGGCVVYNSLHTLQLTPIAPLNNKIYKSFHNSIIVPENKIIELRPQERTKDVLISIDGENKIFCDIDKIVTTVSQDKIKCIRMSKYDYTKVIRTKFLS